MSMPPINHRLGQSSSVVGCLGLYAVRKDLGSCRQLSHFILIKPSNWQSVSSHAQSPPRLHRERRLWPFSSTSSFSLRNLFLLRCYTPILTNEQVTRISCFKAMRCYMSHILYIYSHSSYPLVPPRSFLRSERSYHDRTAMLAA